MAPFCMVESRLPGLYFPFPEPVDVESRPADADTVYPPAPREHLLTPMYMLVITQNHQLVRQDSRWPGSSLTASPYASGGRPW
ncbi:hypothetical protein FJTKL_00048 [Diaporthe vaccinii]|uniref:Uncharacterized protein n=1 Tax=Diaporthe vaccinii TaxID=105482 RepID=A0ABR4E4I8_9PEZI